jgi:transketolase
LTEVIPELAGGSADLTGSNLTKAKSQKTIVPGEFGGSYIHYGVREHGMAAAMNGIALHGGFIPYGGTFLIFTDYCRPSIRLSALMEQRVIYVMTHDSIGLGEDGPTHQPVEHLASLRAIPNLNVYRPCDIVETAECWTAALATKSTPSVISLSRQGLPCLRKDHTEHNLSANGESVSDKTYPPLALKLCSV